MDIKKHDGVSCYSKLEERSVDPRHKALIATNLIYTKLDVRSFSVLLVC